MSRNIRNALSNVFAGGGGGGGATLGANTFVGTQTIQGGLGFGCASAYTVAQLRATGICANTASGSATPDMAGATTGIIFAFPEGMAFFNGGVHAAQFLSTGMRLVSSASIGWGSTAPTSTVALTLSKAANDTLQIGANHATTATAQTFKAHNVTTGTGAALTLAGGTGSTAGGALNLATSATTGAPVTHLEVKASGVINFASASVVTETVVSDRTLAIEVGGTTYKICLKA